MEPLSDVELVKQVRDGKRQAFTELMHRYQQRVYRVARRIVGSHDDAEDIAQETFVKAFLALGDFRGDASFFTWLYRIAVNLSLNAVRKQHVVQYLRHSDLVNRLFPAKENPAEELEFRETESRLRQAVAQLPEKQKAVFVLRYFEEMPYEEISGVLNTSVGGLKANYYHAVRKVRDYLKDENPDPKTGRR